MNGRHFRINGRKNGVVAVCRMQPVPPQISDRYPEVFHKKRVQILVSEKVDRYVVKPRHLIARRLPERKLFRVVIRASWIRPVLCVIHVIGQKDAEIHVARVGIIRGEQPLDRGKEHKLLQGQIFYLYIGIIAKRIEKLRQKIADMIGKNVALNIIEVRSPDLNAQLVAENIAAQLEKRISFRRAMKQAMQRATRLGAKGIKCTCAGRLGGAEIARSESYHEGTIPLQTLRADIEYGFAEANTTYGKVGCKVWIYKGEVLNSTLRSTTVEPPARRDRRDRGDRRDRRPYGERREGDRPFNRDRRPYGDRPGYGERREGDRPNNGERRPFNRPEGGNR